MDDSSPASPPAGSSFFTGQELPQQLALLASIIDLNPYSMALYDADGRFVTGNPAYHRLLGGTPPPDYSLFDDPILERAGLRELFLGLKEGRTVRPPDGIWYNPHELHPDLPDRTLCACGVAFPILGPDGQLQNIVLIHQDVTEHKRAEEALRESRAQLLATIESLPFDCFAIGPDGHYILQNSACRAHWGDIVGRRPSDVAVNDDVRALWEGNNRRAFAGERVEGEVDYTFDGERRHFYNIVGPIRDRGEIRSILGVNIDITQRKRAEEALRSVFANLLDIVVCLDTDLTITRVSPAVETIVGYTPEELIGKRLTDLDFVAPGSREALVEDVGRILAGADLHFPVYEFIAKDGERKSVEVIGRPLWRDDCCVGIIATARDITDRRRAEEALRESEEKHRLLFENVNDIVCSFDSDFRITSVSPSVERVLGYRPEELIGRRIGQLGLLTPPSVDAAVADARRVLAGERVAASTYEFLAKDGTVRCVEVSAAPLFRDGRVVAGVVVGRDITERKLLEAQLCRAQKMEAIGRLAGGIAHDFNNLLTAVTGYSDLVLNRLPPDEPLRRDIEQIRDAGRRATTLTSQLLTFARRQVVQTEAIDLNDVVTGMDQMLRRLLREDIEPVVTLEPELAHVEADRAQIEQVILNLAVNASDAMLQGGTLALETANLTLEQPRPHRGVSVPPGAYVLLTVRDTGVGMDEATLARAFEPFFTTKGVGKGTGLGLPTAYGVVKQSGGYITLDSLPGQGTVCRVYLPATQRPLRPADAAPPGPASLDGSETLLVVEDEECVRDLLRSVLADRGYTILEASDGRQALDRAAEFRGPIHLAVTDVVMPRMDGPDMAIRLQADRPEIRILYISGHMSDALAHRVAPCMEADFLRKPFTPDALARKVRQVLDRPPQPLPQGAAP